MPREIVVPIQSLERYRPLVTAERFADAQRIAATMVGRLKGRAIWNINSTGAGGGVAELLHSIIGYVRGVGVDATWMVIDGTPEFFQLTRRLHDALHGVFDWDSTEAVRSLYESVLEQNALELAPLIQKGDVVIVHDPQPAGLVPFLTRLGATVVWRCHIGHDRFTPTVRKAWDFLAPYVSEAAGLVFTRASYVPPQLSDERITFIPPTIDPFSPKNQELSDEQVRAILVHTGIIEGETSDENRWFTRRDGSPGRVDRFSDVIRLGRAPHWSTPVVTQISRWDYLKDPVGVLKGFVQCHAPRCGGGVHLILAGPNVHGVADDPAAAASFNAVLDEWRKLPQVHRNRVHLVTLPMADIDENAAIVNALQRHSTVVVQKSIHEGFGLTVTEAMWKARPIVASAVSGIVEQIEDGVHGLLVQDPSDLPSFTRALERLLDDPGLAQRLGEQARLRVRENYLGLEAMIRHATFVLELLG